MRSLIKVINRLMMIDTVTVKGVVNYSNGSDCTRCILAIGIINHTLLSIIRPAISTLTCTSKASNRTRDSECYLALRVHVRVYTVAALIVRGLKCVIN
jgi:hypothetical protein